MNSADDPADPLPRSVVLQDFTPEQKAHLDRLQSAVRHGRDPAPPRPAKPVTLANCSVHQIEDVRRRGLHPSRDRASLIFAAGALDNRTLAKGLGSAELATFYDGQVAAGHIERNPYWPNERT